MSFLKRRFCLYRKHLNYRGIGNSNTQVFSLTRGSIMPCLSNFGELPQYWRSRPLILSSVEPHMSPIQIVSAVEEFQATVMRVHDVSGDIFPLGIILDCDGLVYPKRVRKYQTEKNYLNNKKASNMIFSFPHGYYSSIFKVR